MKMAVCRYGFSECVQNMRLFNFPSFLVTAYRQHSGRGRTPLTKGGEKKPWKSLKAVRQFDPITESLASRGFARAKQTYSPPKDAEEQLHLICKEIFGTKMCESWKSTSLTDGLAKYKVLTKCIDRFQYDVPNSYLCKLKTLNDVVHYFTTPVEGNMPYDKLISEAEKLPPNLHVIQDYIRFHPDTDTFFGGVSAFPGSSTIISSVKAKKKYKEYKIDMEWPDI